MVDEVNEISFDEFAEIFRAKAKLAGPISREEIVRAWNIWQTQPCLLCMALEIKFRALYQPNEIAKAEFNLRDDQCGLFMYSLCEICFEHDCIENVSDDLLKASLGSPVH